MGTVKTDNKQDIDQLNSFLRGEMSAVETYRLALDRLETSSEARPQLQTCMSSHQERVRILQSKIVELGGAPADSSGAWGAFAKVVEGGAAVLGDKVAIDALEAGEDHGLKDYRTDVAKLDASVRQLILSDLLPKQESTHRAMSTLKHNFH